MVVHKTIDIEASLVKARIRGGRWEGWSTEQLRRLLTAWRNNDVDNFHPDWKEILIFHETPTDS